MRPLLPTLMVCAIAMPAASGRAFEDRWKDRAVTLRQPLHAIVVRDRITGISTLTPDKGLYYSGFFTRGDVLVDRTPEGLLAQVQALLPGEEPRLISHPAGTRMLVKQVQVGGAFKGRLVWFELADPIAPKRRATALTIEWPMKLKDGFPEAPDVEALAAQVFDDAATR